MTAPRVGVIASARGRCAVCGPKSPGWVRIVTALNLPGGSAVWPCWHCTTPPSERPIPIYIYPVLDEHPRRSAS